MGFKCPACSLGDIVERKSRGRGRLFYACSRFPECKFLTSTKPANEEELNGAFEKWKSNPPKTKKTLTRSTKLRVSGEFAEPLKKEGKK